ncbi:GmrSD restriction endonuclease domain-containing protein [Micromonospora sp. SD12]|uniref:GmrSD restriction endonuclease domain-containing protein n=1 Tax=Micromonospora sp. SD12 TaxID=3452216 RepID=UPI003F8C0E14
MKANETTVRNLLQGEKQYVVPLYQRRYSWKRRDLAQVWADVMRVTEVNDNVTHFLGSVVLAPSPANTPTGVQSWLVVDGQQRLTTLSILLCAIRDHVRESDAQLAAKIDDMYLFNKYASGMERYTLLPTKADRAAWLALVERDPGAGGEDRIGEAYRFFRAALVQADDSDDDHDLIRIEQAVAARLSLVEIAAHPDDNVHRIFESLNYTGQPLTQADLLRNYLFMRLPARGDHVYERHWLPLQELLTDKQLEELVWLDLVLRGDDRATQEAIYQSQQLRLGQLSGEAAIEEWIIDLHHKARLFRKILAPGEVADPILRRALDRLDRWGAAVVHPIALYVLLAHEAGRLSSVEAADALRVVESYLVRRMIAGIASANTNRILMSLVKDLGEQVPSAKAITRALSGVRKKFPTDQYIRDAVLVNSFYWLGRGPQRSYVLRCIEEDFEHKEPINFDTAKVTIEHVLPQSLTDEWREMLAPDLEADETAEELHSSLVHTLGNLSLTAYNPKLANDGFEAKKKILRDSGLAMNREIADSPRWGRTEILARGRALADRVLLIWPGPDESAAVTPPSPRWSLMNQALASIPAGRWTSYSDIAEVVGVFHRAVAGRLASVQVPNAHRVLKIDGAISADFRWVDPQRRDDPRTVLEAEGVRFDHAGRAAADQRMTATELAREVGLDTSEDRDGEEPVAA